MALVKSVVQKLIGELVNRPFYLRTVAASACSRRKPAFNAFRWPFGELAAMVLWVQDADDATAAFSLSKYQAALANTYIAYSGTGNFTAYADHARIDGPSVWIEFLC